MWIDQTAKPFPATTYTLYAMLSNYGYDSDNSPAFWMVLWSSVLQLILQIWSWLPFEAEFLEKETAKHQYQFAVATGVYDRAFDALNDDEDSDL